MYYRDRGLRQTSILPTRPLTSSAYQQVALIVSEGVRVVQWYRRRTEIVKVTGSNLTGAAPNSEKINEQGLVSRRDFTRAEAQKGMVAVPQDSFTWPQKESKRPSMISLSL